MWNLRGTVTLLVGPEQAAGQAAFINTIGIIGQVAGLAAVAWLWRGRWDPRSLDFDLRFALTMVVGLLTSPHLNPHDDLLLVPAACIAYRALRSRPRGGWIGIALAAMPFVVLLTNSVSANDLTTLPIRIPVIVMALFALGLAMALLVRPSVQSPGVTSMGTTSSTDAPYA